MKLNIDSDELSKNSDPEQLTGLASVLEAFLAFVKKLQGTPDVLAETPETPKPPVNDPPKDPVGDVILQGFRNAQGQESIRRKRSGWMSLAPREPDDRHI